ncbi:4Fe-4S dicluster domain-containing protein [Thermodesulfobacteriota bacterium]
MQLGFYFDQTRCIGCYTCQVACKDWYDIPAGPVSRMRIHHIEEGKFPHLFMAHVINPCYHCAEPFCMRACTAGAITKRESDGIVVIDQEKCLGKEKCTMLCQKECPWDVPQFGPEENAKAEKCDFCLDRLSEGKDPICTAACPMRAIEFGPMKELVLKYGDMRKAKGFRYAPKADPSLIIKKRPSIS